MNISKFIEEASWVTLIIFNIIIAGILTLLLSKSPGAYNVENLFKAMLGLVIVIEILLFKLGGKIYEDVKNLL